MQAGENEILVTDVRYKGTFVWRHRPDCPFRQTCANLEEVQRAHEWAKWVDKSLEGQRR